MLDCLVALEKNFKQHFISQGVSKYMVTCIVIETVFRGFHDALPCIPPLILTKFFRITVTSSSNIQIGYWETIYIVRRKGNKFSHH